MVCNNRIGGRCTKMSRKPNRRLYDAVDNTARLDIIYEPVKKLKRRQKKKVI